MKKDKETKKEEMAASEESDAYLKKNKKGKGKGKRKKSPINLNPKNKGKLHKTLGVPPGKKIPASKLAAAAKSKNPTTSKRAQFAINAKKFNHSGTGKRRANAFEMSIANALKGG